MEAHWPDSSHQHQSRAALAAGRCRLLIQFRYTCKWSSMHLKRLDDRTAPVDLCLQSRAEVLTRSWGIGSVLHFVQVAGEYCSQRHTQQSVQPCCEGGGLAPALNVVEARVSNTMSCCCSARRHHAVSCQKRICIQPCSGCGICGWATTRQVSYRPAAKHRHWVQVCCISHVFIWNA